MDEIINKSLSNKVLLVSVTYKTDGPCGGGVSSVLASYEKYFYRLRHIPTWKITNKINKLWYFMYHYLWFLILLIFDRRIKIVHIHTAAGPSFERKMLMTRTAKLFRKKVILHMHAADFVEYYNESKSKKWIEDSIRKCDLLIVLSPSWRDFFISIGINSENIIILNNIVTPQVVVDNRIDKELKFLFLGWLGKRKGIWDLLDVIIEHHDELKGKFFLRFGGNDFENEINQLIEKKELNDVVKFEGWVSGKKKEECLSWANVFILPSYNEGLPISILEAMTYGMPIISTTVGGIPEVVKDRQNGFLIHAGDKKQIWDSIKYLIDNPDKVKLYGSKSLELVKPYTPEFVMNRLKLIYKNLLRNG